MKIYLVVDSYQYDGGFVIEGAYENPDEALKHQQKLRRSESKRMSDLKKTERSKLVRLEAIHVEELVI